ncbi:hypothetical protein LI168_07780 [Desulfovibrio desulfuricans]|uniref:hypothetical protein n=1 Tax=Desulfovibrio desulfuricans TaxID=876 RepID=UPI001D0613DC|nr:hypothetical protein [Desulfovibrio desulfuricans]MCB6542103.1 hypothetical protein [Desulfovibrio desulfuricans]MCB6553117.1 hypothetical protein [Desulfovibrio desulfuricans]MCB6565080.1 hypothetical protein [Desulfovibrio desulfuricans]MCB7346142.1 hypothetical protein [Desulfovibrio desulfuricans]MCQ5218526.1 hypothetical protein [Desulfovibrio desulfuricans]
MCIGWMFDNNATHTSHEGKTAEEHRALAEEPSTLAEMHTEMAELKEEQSTFLLYKDFCDMRNEWKELSKTYEESGDYLRAEAISSSIPVAPELLDYLKRRNGKQYFEEIILGSANIYEALLVYGPARLEFDENAEILPGEKVLSK